MNSETLEKINHLANKYKEIGLDLNTVLEGLYESKPLNYWDYLNLEALLALQNPRTDYPDEIVFITYHQVTELYFKLILHEIDQILNAPPQKENILKRIKRIASYFKQLSTSFETMVIGMDTEQFLRFRLTLVPASGFQSVQYRIIEIKSTTLINLVHYPLRKKYDSCSPLSEIYANLYWKYGNRREEDGEKTVTLKRFEEKYDTQLYALAEACREKNLWFYYQNLSEDIKNDKEIIESLRNFDLQANVFWPLSHYKVAAKYFSQPYPATITQGTGGTNWKEYLPPKKQHVIFFPELWNEQEHQEWGAGPMQELFTQQVEHFWQTQAKF
ncbi:MAG: tryptophan 2,3-dioxygenase family protein [Bacteroidia bacterium]|nr:tryptophan 2,3-dioxygenase family protein [Bacteroidia bacterium]MDW8158625.1 tryptophan 2,3-dioxygenase family protein [Bacteroidia bacterium]